MSNIKKIPVNIGDTMVVVPQGMAKNDPFVKIEGFMIFIKNTSKEQEQSRMKIKITAIKPTFGFAEPTKKGE